MSGKNFNPYLAQTSHDGEPAEDPRGKPEPGPVREGTIGMPPGPSL